MDENPIVEILEPISGAISEVAKASQESDKTLQKGMDVLSQFGGFINGIFGAAFKEIGLGVAERAKAWRFENSLKVLQRTQKLIEDRGLSREQLKELPFGQVLLATRSFSEEETETVQELWSNLLANALDPGSSVTIEKVFVRLLRDISPAEAALLDLIVKLKDLRFERNADRGEIEAKLKEMVDEKWRKFSDEDRSVAVQNLVALRCITFRPVEMDGNGLFHGISVDARNPHLDRDWAVIKPHKFVSLVNDILKMMEQTSGVRSPDVRRSFRFGHGLFGSFGVMTKPIELEEFAYVLTPLGEKLVAACKVNSA